VTPDNPEQGIRFPAVQTTEMPDGTLVVDGEVDGRRVIGAVAPSADTEPDDPPCVVDGCGWGDPAADGSWTKPTCGQGSWRYECRLNWASTDPEDREPYGVYLAERPDWARP
jgi:hypothetical protein